MGTSQSRGSKRPSDAPGPGAEAKRIKAPAVPGSQQTGPGTSGRVEEPACDGLAGADAGDSNVNGPEEVPGSSEGPQPGASQRGAPSGGGGRGFSGPLHRLWSREVTERPRAHALLGDGGTGKENSKAQAGGNGGIGTDVKTVKDSRAYLARLRQALDSRFCEMEVCAPAAALVAAREGWWSALRLSWWWPHRKGGGGADGAMEVPMGKWEGDMIEPRSSWFWMGQLSLCGSSCICLHNGRLFLLIPTFVFSSYLLPSLSYPLSLVPLPILSSQVESHPTATLLFKSFQMRPKNCFFSRRVLLQSVAPVSF